MNKKSMDKRIYSENIHFGEHSFFERLISRTKAYKEFQTMAAFVTSVYRGSDYPFIIVDSDMVLQYMNPACREFSHIKEGDIQETTTCSSLFKSDLCEQQCPLKQAMKSKQMVTGIQVSVQDRKGVKHTIIVNAGPIIARDGEVLGGFEIWRDALPDVVAQEKNRKLRKDASAHISRLESLTKELEKNGGSSEVCLSIRDELQRYTQEFDSNFTDCWDIMDCPSERQVKCPAFPHNGKNCMEVPGTMCQGQKHPDVDLKVYECMSCASYKEHKERCSLGVKRNENPSATTAR
ncbi:MAG: PAS domain-containing protein [Planctomycetes bacterium]|nr:PAS domain-containing protein [Planctomycetota bacterium]